jgi:hypothetical protein
MNILGLFTTSPSDNRDIIYAASHGDVDNFIRLYDMSLPIKDENIKYTIVTGALYSQSLTMLSTLKKFKFTFTDTTMVYVIINDLSISMKWLIDEIKPIDDWDYIVQRVIEYGSVKCFHVLIHNSDKVHACRDGISHENTLQTHMANW